MHKLLSTILCQIHKYIGRKNKTNRKHNFHIVLEEEEDVAAVLFNPYVAIT